MEERSKVSLRCEASGYPPPTITWRREDGKDINLGSYGGRKYSGNLIYTDFNCMHLVYFGWIINP